MSPPSPVTGSPCPGLKPGATLVAPACGVRGPLPGTGLPRVWLIEMRVQMCRGPWAGLGVPLPGPRLKLLPQSHSPPALSTGVSQVPARLRGTVSTGHGVQDVSGQLFLKTLSHCLALLEAGRCFHGPSAGSSEAEVVQSGPFRAH